MTIPIFFRLQIVLYMFQENYFGEDQKFTDYGEVFSQTDKQSTFEHITSPVDRRDHPFDPRRYRPLEVKVQATLHDIQAHLPKVTFLS